jgi:ribosomal protein L11 methylase PrmA
MAAIKAVSKKGSYILLSGFIKADEPIMLKALAETNIQPLKTLQKGEWISILAQMSL